MGRFGTYYYEDNAIETLTNKLFNKLTSDKIVICCIGTDRSTGDCLGPFVGTKLLESSIADKVKIFGSLEYPVHANNLRDTMYEIERDYGGYTVIAIDACLGSLETLDKIYIEDTPIHPGAAMLKDLPAVGDISITGIVNVSGNLEFMILQNTRLHKVFNLVNTISEVIEKAVNRYLSENKHILEEEVTNEQIYSVK